MLFYPQFDDKCENGVWWFFAIFLWFDGHFWRSFNWIICYNIHDVCNRIWNNNRKISKEETVTTMRKENSNRRINTGCFIRMLMDNMSSGHCPLKSKKNVKASEKLHEKKCMFLKTNKSRSNFRLCRPWAPYPEPNQFGIGTESVESHPIPCSFVFICPIFGFQIENERV